MTRLDPVKVIGWLAILTGLAIVWTNVIAAIVRLI